MIRKLWRELTSYPMRRLDWPPPFTDIVSGATVHYFTDRFGRRFMAEHRWAWFRVEIPAADRFPTTPPSAQPAPPATVDDCRPQLLPKQHTTAPRCCGAHTHQPQE